MLRLGTFGGLTLSNGQGELMQPRRRLALLARIAAAGTRGVSRDELFALFWAERDIETARHSLDQLLYELRRSLGALPTVGTARLCADPDVIVSDVADWAAAHERAEPATAVALYRGSFLHGFYLHGSPEFERWAEVARARYAAEYRRDLEALATIAARDHRMADAVTCWRKLVEEDRVSSRAALGLMRALADAGDRGGALAFSRTHERLVRAELESAPDPAVVAFADSLRESRTTPPTPGADLPALSVLPDPSVETFTTSRENDAQRVPTASPRHRRVFARATLLMFTAVGSVYIATARRTDRTAPIAGEESPPARAGRGNSSIAAHDLYRRARDPAFLRTDSGVRTAIGLLSQAVTLDPKFAAGYAALAGLHATATWGTTLTLPERRASLEQAATAARQAVLLDDSLGAAHAELGYVLMLEYKPLAARVELERAIALDPNDGASSELLTKAYEWTGRADDAVIEAKRALRVNPVSPSINAELGDALYFAHHYDEAVERLQKVAGLEPPLRRVPEYLAEVYIATHRWSDAVALLKGVADRQPGVRGLLGYALARSGARAEARRLLQEMMGDESAGLAPALGVAEIYVGLGDRERAFVWLERAFTDYSLRASIMGPAFDELRADPRFGAVAKRLKLPF